MTTIARINILATIITGAVLSASVIYLFIYLPSATIDRQIEQTKSNIIATRKENIKTQTLLTVARIKDLQQDFSRRLDQRLRQHHTSAAHIVAHMVEAHGGLGVAQCRVLHAAQPPASDDDFTILLLVYDTHGTLRYSSSGATDENSASFSRRLQQLLRQKAPERDNQPVTIMLPATPPGEAQQHIRLIDSIDPSNHWRTVTAINENQARRQMQYQFLQRLSKFRFGTGDYGYFYVLNAQARPLMIAIMQPALNPDLTPLPTPRGMQPAADAMVKVARNGGDFYHFKFINPAHGNKVEEKYAYMAWIPRWNWAIGTGFYASELNAKFIAAERKLRDEYAGRATIGYILLAANLLIGLFIAVYTNRHLLRLEHKRAEHLRHLEQYQQLLDQLCMVAKRDLNGICTYVNDNFCTISGYPRDELVGQPITTVIHPAESRQVIDSISEQMLKRESWHGILRNRHKDGRSFYTDTVIKPIFAADGSISEYVEIRYDITELLEKRDKLKEIFATDSLTGLSSRHQLIEDIKDLPREISLLLLDIDDFSGINDELGPEQADKILRYLSDHLRDFFPASDCRLYRLHSDVFAVLAITTDSNYLAEHCRSFYAFLTEHPYCHNDICLSINMVGGIARHERNLLSCADIALKHAKNNQQEWVVYSKELDEQYAHSRSYWINQVQTALQQQRIVPFYQAIVDLKTGKHCKYEALMRLLDTNGQVVPPGEFLPILEQTRHYPHMTHAIVEQACAFFSNRTEQFSVNLSLDDLLRQQTVEFIVITASQYGVRERLVLEIIETENIHNYDQAIAALTELQQMGFSVAIDDFGSGYANFSYLTKLNARFVKIDGSLIQQINNDVASRNLVETLVKYAHDNGMQVIAEYVSDGDIMETVTAIGCDYGQGYYFMKPTRGKDLPVSS